MGIAVWAGIVGALLGCVLGDFSEFGFLLGGGIGAGMGVWLRSIIRREITDAVRSATAESIPTTLAQTHPATIVTAASETTEMVSQPSIRVPAVSDELTHPLDITEKPPAPSVAAPAPYVPAPPSRIDQLLSKARDWLLGGNTIVRAGLAILFLGLVFLVRFVAIAGMFPIEARLALVAAAGVALLYVGLRKRVERPPFALSLQGAGIAVLYLVIFAAAKAYGIMPPLVAFAFMILFAALGCVLAVMQNSLAMAFVAFLGGFAVPVLLGGKSDTPLGLFVYMTILNLAIFGIAWKKSWRPLNLLGFVATFALASAWGFAAYQAPHYLLCQVFLIVSMAIYLATAVLYAHNTPGKLGNYADSTLLFGTALAGFGLQIALVHDHPFASAYAALGFGAAYIAVAAVTMRKGQHDMRLLNECLLAIGVGFVTLAVPLALDVHLTSSVWALEGAGAFWVGARQARWIPRCFGLALQALAGLLTFAVTEPNISAIPLANNGFLLAMLVAIPMLYTAWLMRHPLDHSGSVWARVYANAEQELSPPWFLAGFAFICLAFMREAKRLLPAVIQSEPPMPVFSPHMQIYAAVLAILGAMVLAEWFGRRKNWPVASWPGRMSLPLLALCFLAIVIHGRHLLYLPDVLCWGLAAGLHIWLLRRQPVSRWTHAMHVGGVLLLTSMLADCIRLGVDHGALWGTSWAGVTFLVSATLMLLALTRWPGKASSGADLTGFGWPLNPYAKAYWWHGALVLAVLVYGGALASCLLAEGVTDPLPYLPVLNPVDLSGLLALSALALWRRMLRSAQPRLDTGQWVVGRQGLVAMAVLGFVLANTVWLRTAHHALGVAWNANSLANSQIVQSGYSILWTLIAMGL
ncbi:MAG: DUF2339 domain-containing protein, partial [Sphingobium sp.]